MPNMKLIIQLGSKPLQDLNCLNNSFMMVSTVQLGPSCRPWSKVLFIRGLVILFFSGKASHQHLKHLCGVWSLILRRTSSPFSSKVWKYHQNWTLFHPQVNHEWTLNKSRISSWTPWVSGSCQAQIFKKVFGLQSFIWL